MVRKVKMLFNKKRENKAKIAYDLNATYRNTKESDGKQAL